MDYYKDCDGVVYAYDDDQTPMDGLVKMTPEEVDAHVNPKPSQSELVSQAESQKAQLAAAAEQSIRPLERAKQLGIATDEELAALTEWERYSVFLMRVDTSKAPDIDWPVVPTV